MGFVTADVNLAVNVLRAFSPVLITGLLVCHNRWLRSFNRRVVDHNGPRVLEDRTRSYIVLNLEGHVQLDRAARSLRSVLARSNDLAVLDRNIVLRRNVLIVFLDLDTFNFNMAHEVGVVISNLDARQLLSQG